MPHTVQGNERPSLHSLWWGMAVSLWLAVMILAGGTSVPSPAVLTVQTLLSAGLALLAAWRLRTGFPTWTGLAGLILLLLALVLTLVQLIPLPPGIWMSLPGRGLVAATYQASGEAAPWLPLNLQPVEGYASALALIPAFAGFLAALTLDWRNAMMVGTALLLCALAGAVLALTQKFAGPGQGLYFYTTPAGNIAMGTFSNRNFLAAQLFTAVPFVAALATTATDAWRMKPWLMSLFAVIYMGILLAALAAVGSRAGVLLAMLAVFLAFAVVFRWRRFAQSGAAILAALAALFVIGQASMVGILRLVQKDPLDDFRATIFAVSLDGVKAFFPAGSGFGSFASAYQMFERPADIIDNYVNHAHNDWLEIVFAGGLPALILLVAFVVLFAVTIVRLMRLSMFSHGGALYRAGGVAAFLLLLHAAVDFGLRTPALLSVFSVCLGLATLAGAALHNHRHHATSQPDPAAASHTPRPFVPGAFGTRNAPKVQA